MNALSSMISSSGKAACNNIVARSTTTLRSRSCCTTTASSTPAISFLKITESLNTPSKINGPYFHSSKSTFSTSGRGNNAFLITSSSPSSFENGITNFASSSSRASTSRFFSTAKNNKKYYDNSKAQMDYERSQEMMEKFEQKRTDHSTSSSSGSATTTPTTTTLSSSTSATTTTSSSSSKKGGITSATMREQQKILFPKLSEEATDAEFDDIGATILAEDNHDELASRNNSTKATEHGGAGDEADAEGGAMKTKKELGFKYLGKEPTAYGDWSHKGRVTDF